LQALSFLLDSELRPRVAHAGKNGLVLTYKAKNLLELWEDSGRPNPRPSQRLYAAGGTRPGFAPLGPTPYNENGSPNRRGESCRFQEKPSGS
jgi:hypothetical protein